MENKLRLLLDNLNQTRQEMMRLKSPQNIKKHSTPNKLMSLGLSLKSTLTRIANFGTRYSLVKVYLVRVIKEPGTNPIYTEIYFTDITKEDAEEFVKNFLEGRTEKEYEFYSCEYVDLGLKTLFANKVQ